MTEFWITPIKCCGIDKDYISVVLPLKIPNKNKTNIVGMINWKDLPASFKKIKNGEVFEAEIPVSIPTPEDIKIRNFRKLS